MSGVSLVWCSLFAAFVLSFFQIVSKFSFVENKLHGLPCVGPPSSQPSELAALAWDWLPCIDLAVAVEPVSLQKAGPLLN